MAGSGDLLDRMVECGLVSLRGFVEAGDFADKLKCGCFDFFGRGGDGRVAEDLDRAAHGSRVARFAG